jgi:hypothetical protein
LRKIGLPPGLTLLVIVLAVFFKWWVNRKERQIEERRRHSEQVLLARFSKLHEMRAEAIIVLLSRVRYAGFALGAYLDSTMSSEGERALQRTRAVERVRSLEDFWEDREVLFTESVQDIMKRILTSAWWAKVNLDNSRTGAATFEPVEMWDSAHDEQLRRGYDIITTEMPKLREALAAEFRRILGTDESF